MHVSSPTLSEKVGGFLGWVVQIDEAATFNSSLQFVKMQFEVDVAMSL